MAERMLPQIHILDLLAVACLTAGIVLPLRKRTAGLIRSKFSTFAGLLSGTLLFSFLLLHVWAQFRPLAPVVEVRRHLRAEEREQFRRQLSGPVPVGFPLPDVNSFTTSEFIPLDHSSQTIVQGADIREIRRLLAWSSWWPEMPKQLVVQTDSPMAGEARVVAEFNVRLLQQKRVEFVKRDGKWVIRNTRPLKYCGGEPTDFVARAKAAFPIDFSGYHSTF